MLAARFACAVAILALSACGGVSGDKTDPGPFPGDYSAMVRMHLQRVLKDPYSVQDLSISKPVRASVWTGLVRSGSVETWASCVSYNAKNSFGAYVGLRSYTYHFRNYDLFNVVDGC